MVRRRTLSMVEIPAALAAAMEDAMRSGTRGSSKQQRLESQQLLGTLRQLSRSRSRGGSNALPDTAADTPAPMARLRGSRARGDEVSTMPGPYNYNCSASPTPGKVSAKLESSALPGSVTICVKVSARDPILKLAC